MCRLLAGLLALTIAGSALAQRSVDFVIPFAPGGTADRLALFLMPWLKTELAPHGITPMLTYRPGAGGALAAAAVARADRLQIFLAPNAVVTAAIVNPQAANYSLSRDFVPVAYLGHAPMMLMVNAQSRIKTWQDLRSHCAINTVSYGSAGLGSATHIATALVLQHLNCKSNHVPYKGVGPAMIDLLGQHIDIVVDFVASARPLIDNGSVRVLLSVDRKGYQSIPGLADIGYRDFDFYNWFVLLANSAATSADITVIQQVMNRLMVNSDFRKQLADLGLLGVGQTMPADFLQQQEIKFRQIISRTHAVQ